MVLTNEMFADEYDGMINELTRNIELTKTDFCNGKLSVMFFERGDVPKTIKKIIKQRSAELFLKYNIIK